MDYLSARASGNRQRLPGIRLAEETGAGLDFVDQASVVIVHVVDSATDPVAQLANQLEMA